MRVRHFFPYSLSQVHAKPYMIVSVRRATQLRPSAARDRQGQNSASEELKLYDTSSLRDIAGAGATAAGETVTIFTDIPLYIYFQ